MTTLSKDEILAMAREAGAVFDPQWGIASNIGTATFERFAALCRAPLVAEVERLTADLEQTRVQLAGCGVAAMQNTEESKANRVERGAYGWSASYGDVCRMVDREIELRAGVEVPDCATTGVCVRSGLYASPPSAVPVVEQLVEALDGLFSGDVVVWSLGGSARPRAAITAGQKFIKENGK